MTPHHPVTFHGMSSKPSAAPGRPGRPRGRGSRGRNWSTAKKRKSPPFDGTVYLGTEIVLETSRGGGDGRSHEVTSYNPRRARWTATPRDGDGPEEEITHGRLLLGADARLDGGDGDGRRHVGRRVTRTHFDRARTPYHGTVDGVDEAEGLWHVRYDDGDEEEVELMELLVAADLYDRLHGRGAFRRPNADGGAGTGAAGGGDAAPARRGPGRAAASLGVALLAVAAWYVRRAWAVDGAGPGGTPPRHAAGRRGRGVGSRYLDVGGSP